jgi:hypothetical protein
MLYLRKTDRHANEIRKIKTEIDQNRAFFISNPQKGKIRGRLEPAEDRSEA